MGLKPMTGWRRSVGIILFLLLVITAVIARISAPWSSLYFDIGAIVLIAVILGVLRLLMHPETANKQPDSADK
ncbi:MAG: hypothetical protein AB1450_02210 [Pseudomonadota bacterium]